MLHLLKLRKRQQWRFSNTIQKVLLYLAPARKGEEDESSDLLGTTTPSGPSPLRGSGAPSEVYDEVREESIAPVVQDGKVKKNLEERHS